jgi:hypothetical protein
MYRKIRHQFLDYFQLWAMPTFVGKIPVDDMFCIGKNSQTFSIGELMVVFTIRGSIFKVKS